MKTRNCIFFILMIVVIIISISCEKKDSQPDKIAVPEDTVIESDTLDGGEEEADVLKKESAEESIITEQADSREEPGKTSSTRTEADIWNDYNQARENLQTAKTEENFTEIKKYLLLTAGFARELNRDDIEAWQYNNIGFYGIEEFKKKVDYQERIAALETMKPGTEKAEFYRSIVTDFRQESDFLSEIKTYLETARKIDGQLPVSERTEMIANNVGFIEDIQAMLSED